MILHIYPASQLPSTKIEKQKKQLTKRHNWFKKLTRINKHTATTTFREAHVKIWLILRASSPLASI